MMVVTYTTDGVGATAVLIDIYGLSFSQTTTGETIARFSAAGREYIIPADNLIAVTLW